MKIGLQLYSVRDHVEKQGLMRVLELVSEMGYEGVEFAGYFDHDSRQLAQKLNQLGLAAAGSHLGYDSLAGNLEEQLKFASELSAFSITLPWMNRQDFEENSIGEKSEEIEKMAKRAADYNITFCYHNHDHELVSFRDSTALEEFLELAPSLKLQLDVYWLIYAGLEPLSFMRKHSKKLPMIHIKDMAEGDNITTSTPNPAIGEGVLDTKGILSAANELGVEWAIVEMDECFTDSLEAAKLSIDNIRKMGY